MNESKPLIFYRTAPFLKRWKKWSHVAELDALERELEQHPDAGAVIAGSGGIRKLRYKRPGMGKRGGLRIIYYFKDTQGLIILLTVYAKSEMEDLPKKSLKAMQLAVHEMMEGNEHDT